MLNYLNLAMYIRIPEGYPEIYLIYYTNIYRYIYIGVYLTGPWEYVFHIYLTLEGDEKMIKKISCNVPEEWNIKRKQLGLTWFGILKRGFDMIEYEPKLTVIQEEYKRLEDKQARTAALLQKYAEMSKEYEK